MLKGGARQAHAESCRKRLEKELEGTERAERLRRKVDEFVEEAIAKSDRQRKEDADKKYMNQGPQPMDAEQPSAARESGQSGDEDRKRVLEIHGEQEGATR